ncbi:hypothetical protein AYO44_03840 [Planctomycetaceae bacterium SCGC AG-212-F19]|nr:hypothetical protein AYO44_03840 [Planctomycetaceae bacterium SCGC AG-212-F19]
MHIQVVAIIMPAKLPQVTPMAVRKEAFQQVTAGAEPWMMVIPQTIPAASAMQIRAMFFHMAPSVTSRTKVRKRKSPRQPMPAGAVVHAAGRGRRGGWVRGCRGTREDSNVMPNGFSLIFPSGPMTPITGMDGF